MMMKKKNEDDDFGQAILEFRQKSIVHIPVGLLGGDD
jgi:hypothetical protein